MEAAPFLRSEPTLDDEWRENEAQIDVIEIAPASELADLKAHGRVEVPNVARHVNYTISAPATDLEDPHVHMIVPGYGGFKRSSRKLRDTLAGNHGIVSLSYDPARRGGGARNDLFNAQQVHIDTVEAIAQDIPNNPALQDIPAIRQINFDKLVLVPHSMGGIPATEYALNHSENVDRMVLMAVVGAEESVKFGFVPRLGRSIKNEIGPAIRSGGFGGPKDGLVMAERALKYYGSNPARTIGEAISCMFADRREQIRMIGELGVRTALYLPANDELIPADKALDGAKDLVDYYETADNLNHLGPQIKSRRVASDIARISKHLTTL